jgi:hypothetical protein
MGLYFVIGQNEDRESHAIILIGQSVGAFAKATVNVNHAGDTSAYLVARRLTLRVALAL